MHQSLCLVLGFGLQILEFLQEIQHVPPLSQFSADLYFGGLPLIGGLINPIAKYSSRRSIFSSFDTTYISARNLSLKARLNHTFFPSPQ